jgi:hypothetical protein
MGTSSRKPDVLRLIGDPKRVHKELAAFRRTARKLSSAHPRMIDKYARQWVALYQGKVAATARTLDGVIAAVRAKGLPRSRVVIRFIEKTHRTMIL